MTSLLTEFSLLNRIYRAARLAQGLHLRSIKMRLSSWFIFVLLTGAALYALPLTRIPQDSADVFYTTAFHLLHFIKLF